MNDSVQLTIAPLDWACSAALVGPIKPMAALDRCFLKLAGTGMSPDERQEKSEDRRRARLAASLRENLKRRKAQSRARAAEAQPSERPEAEELRDPSG